MGKIFEYTDLLNKALKTKNKDDCLELAKWFFRNDGCEYWNMERQGFELENGLFLIEIAEYNEDGEQISSEWKID